MMDRLYYDDPYIRAFDATVVEVAERDGRTLVVLDRTGFYPTSGGQPFDTGTLGDLRVVDVFDDDDGRVLHVVEGGRSAGGHAGLPLQPGRTVHGEVDWPRRFDHMQQHTGQHVLSGAFDRLFGVRTVSFHLGADVSTIDLARELPAGDIAAGESEANRIVWENRPVAIRYADADEAAQMPLRKRLRPARDVERERAGVGPREPKKSRLPRQGLVRLIDIDGFDLSACGGTHVGRTGAIGIIAIVSWERFKGGQRLEFVCGSRALDRFRSMRDMVASSMRLLSVSAPELPEAIERLQGEAREHKRAVALLQTDLARYRADDLAASAEESDRGRLVIRTLDADANGLKSLASAIVARPGHAVVLLSASTPALVVIARSADVAVQANQVLAALTSQFGGRGGGKPELAQGGGLNGSADAILEAARRAILA